MAKSERLKGSNRPASPKITIGDGSVRDLAYWLMGGDLPVKRGRKKVSATSIRNETKKIIPTILRDSKVRVNREKYGSAYDPLTNYSGKFSPEQVEERNRINQLTESRERTERDKLASYEQSPQGEFYTGTGNPMNQGTTSNDRMNNRPMPMYGRRKDTPTQPMINNLTTPTSPNRPVPLMNSNIKPIKPVEDFGRIGDAYEGDPEFGYDLMMTPPLAYGGKVSTPKKKKKKRMYSGKMKRYAKGGGIRKPKYS